MNERPHEPSRVILHGVTPFDVLRWLPQMGRVMVIAQQGPVTHERIGLIEAVEDAGGRLHLTGAHHDALISVEPLVRMTLDTSSVIRDKVYPRLDFIKADGSVAFGLSGWDGLAAFVTPLDGLARTSMPLRDRPVTPDGPRAEYDPADPICAPLQTALDDGAPVLLRFDDGVLCQSWKGRIEALKPAMGFLNIMTPDFHLHLQGGAFLGWQETADGALVAVASDKTPSMLTMHRDVAL